MNAAAPSSTGNRSSRSRERLLLAPLALLAVVASLLWRGEVARQDATRPRDVILISLDTLRADHLGAYGYPRPTSPCIDRLARRSIVFEQVFSHATWTLPSHMSLFTSLLPREHGVVSVHERLGDDHPTLPAVLRDAGYRTAAFTAGANLAARYGFDRGFDVYREDYPRPPDAVSGKGHRVRDILPYALAWLDADRSTPFFLFLHGFDVHEPFVPHRELASFDDDYDGPLRAIGDPATFGRSDLHRTWARDGASFNVVDFLAEVVNRGRITLDARDVRYVTALYDGEVRAADDAICTLVAALGRRGLADRTIIVITADHGQELYERGRIGHGGAPYDVLTHVPLVVHVPGAHGVRAVKLAGLVDVAPTILALLGRPPVQAFDGRALVPLDAPGDDAVVSESAGVVAIRTADRKLMVGPHGAELYDPHADPHELHDVAADEPATVTRLRATLDAAERSTRVARHNPPAPPPTETERERLRALGYAQ